MLPRNSTFQLLCSCGNESQGVAPSPWRSTHSYHGATPSARSSTYLHYRIIIGSTLTMEKQPHHEASPPLRSSTLTVEKHSLPPHGKQPLLPKSYECAVQTERKENLGCDKLLRFRGLLFSVTKPLLTDPIVDMKIMMKIKALEEVLWSTSSKYEWWQCKTPDR